MASNPRIGCATSERFIDLVVAHDFADLPGDVITAAKTFLADTLAVGVAGAGMEGAAKLLSTCTGTGPCGVLGSPGVTLPPYEAALVNGFQIHCLEWDGLHEPSVVIALCATTAALISECQLRAVSGQELINAFVTGVESAVFFGAAATTGPRFFRPSVAGLMGAAMAVGRIRRFSRAQMLDLLGLAYSQISGTMQAHWEGSEALALQVGIAARAALTAADLVAAGLTGPHDVIDGEFGYFRLIETAGDLEPVFAAWGRPWKIMEVAHKPFPAGRATQATLTALKRVQKETAFTMADVEALTVRVPPLIMLLVGRRYHPEMSPSYARLCMDFVAPEMIEQGRVDPRRFTVAQFRRPEAAEFAARVHVVPDGNPDTNTLSPQQVEIRLKDGRVFEYRIDAPWGSPANPLDRVAQIEKAQFCFEVGGFNADAAYRFAAIDQLDQLPDVRTALHLFMNEDQS